MTASSLERPAATDQAPGRRALRQAERREAFLRIAARVFREGGLANATMADVAAAAGVTKVVLYRRFASKDELLQAIFRDILGRMQSATSGPWYGYGSNARAALAAARSFEDAYVLLVRDGHQQPALRPFYEEHRARMRSRLRRLLWFPDRPPRKDEAPALLEALLEPMITFCNDALAHWVEHGDPAWDDQFLHWSGAQIRSWRNNTAELLDLPSKDRDWPFESENAAPLT